MTDTMTDPRAAEAQPVATIQRPGWPRKDSAVFFTMDHAAYDLPPGTLLYTEEHVNAEYLRGWDAGCAAVAQVSTPSPPAGAEVASLPALWRLREDNGEEHSEYDKGFETASDECARMLEDALAKQPATVDIEELRRALCVIGVVGTIDGYDVIRRESMLDIIDRRRSALAAQQGGES